MKLFRVMLVAIAVLLTTKNYSQKISLSVKNASLDNVFRLIENQTSYKFVYTNEAMAVAKPVSVDLKSGSLSDVLKLCFSNQPLSYLIDDNFIIVKADNKKIGNVAALHSIRGIITDEAGEPLSGATITLSTSGKKIIANDKGLFAMDISGVRDSLIVTHIGYNTKTIFIAENDAWLSIRLSQNINEIADITVNTGYQKIPKERATGSFDFVDNKLINRSVTTNVLDRIENPSPGVLFDRNTRSPDKLLIRGRSTIYANAAPLIIVDNFPYDGNINNINPNDVESVTILKDAAAASIWGARAGNGVIVITTKRGKTQKPQVELNTSITITQKPDLFNVNTISSADYIELEKFLFKKHYYNYPETAPYPFPLTPVVELLIKERDGIISTAEANEKIESLKKFDIRNDEERFLYRTGILQQHALNVSGNTQNINYYLSAGWDKNLLNLVGKQYDRVTLRTQNSFKPTTNLQLDIGVSYVQSISKEGNNPGFYVNNGAGKSIYPYARLVDNDGEPIVLVRDYRKSYAENAEASGLLNWQYNPIEDIGSENNSSKTNDFAISAGMRYYITPHLSAEIKYQYENTVNTTAYLHSEASYFTRNLINSFTQIDLTTGSLSSPIPKGDIEDLTAGEIVSHQGRSQLNFSKAWHTNHLLAAIAGWEIKSVTSLSSSHRIYGYQQDRGMAVSEMDFVTQFPLYYYTALYSSIPNLATVSKLTDRFISYYGNASYTYLRRYTISVSARRDEANLFGVKTNQKGTPLWSAGVAWTIDKEKFYSIKWLPLLKLRATYGYNGNISRIASAYTTVNFYTAHTTPAVEAFILNPPNESLRWEQVRILNVGLEFSAYNQVLSGSIEYYKKHSKYLMGQAPLDPTLGLSDDAGQNFFYGNVAAMEGKGVDIELNSKNLNGKLYWTTTFVLSWASSKITDYLLPVNASGSVYLDTRYINPVVGKPVYGVYSYRWLGLDSKGNPQGYFNGKKSKDYASIYAQTPLDSMVYNGPLQPTIFGALRNSLSFKNISVSFNISYKFGYYFRKASLNYDELYTSWTGSGDYALRWQKPGDEVKTNVPSRKYPANDARDFFYENAEVLVEKGNHIRLEDISLSYDLDKEKWHHLPLKHIKVYAYAANLALLWVANKGGIDPYYNNIPANRKNFSIGINVIF